MDECIALAWYMRGSLGYEDAYEITPKERKRMTKFLKERLDIEFKKPPTQVY